MTGDIKDREAQRSNLRVTTISIPNVPSTTSSTETVTTSGSKWTSWIWRSVTHFSSLRQVHHGVWFEVVLVLSAQNRCDDDDDHRNHSDGSQHRCNDPQVVRGVLHHSYRKWQTNIGKFYCADARFKLLPTAFNCLHITTNTKELLGM